MSEQPGGSRVRFNEDRVDPFKVALTRIVGTCVIPRFISQEGDVKIGINFENKWGHLEDDGQGGRVWKVTEGKEDEARFGFVFGVVDPRDKCIMAIGERELKEEMVHQSRHGDVRIRPEDYVGKFSIKNDKSILPLWFVIFSPVLPADTPIRPGPEQKDVFKVTPAKLGELVLSGLLFPNHAKAWKLFGQHVLEMSRALP